MLFEGEPRYLAHTAPPNARNHGWGTARFFAPDYRPPSYTVYAVYAVLLFMLFYAVCCLWVAKTALHA